MGEEKEILNSSIVEEEGKGIVHKLKVGACANDECSERLYRLISIEGHAPFAEHLRRDSKQSFDRAIGVVSLIDGRCRPLLKYDLWQLSSFCGIRVAAEAESYQNFTVFAQSSSSFRELFVKFAKGFDPGFTIFQEQQENFNEFEMDQILPEQLSGRISRDH